ncbi:hypothetical protein MMC14_001213 [Varicellaria rhodocarpa]|nr:hypothetical protein [Varicellaria rhodocarpa]
MDGQSGLLDLTLTDRRIGVDRPGTSLSRFESIIASHAPVLESLLLQLPTPALLNLYHTSRYLRSFLQSYPIAWKYLSFRLFKNTLIGSSQGATNNDTSNENTVLRSKPFALDLLLVKVILPCGTRLCNLDLDNTAVSGQTLTTILPLQSGTLQHLSIRGCKNVSLKYHIIPYLNVFGLQRASDAFNPSYRPEKLSLRSLYTFRCRHHRRRPYFPNSLQRRDSDAEPTHELIRLCHDLGIWTDTGWCPTPGGRCLRRKEYYAGRAENRGEVWVVYDRLWRCSNKLGKVDGANSKTKKRQGLMWEEIEEGEDGEPIGVGLLEQGEGKTVPAHLRRSHKIFVEGYKCYDCGTQISERCEICSVRMHCMGCRKVLCASCAFSRPLPGKSAKSSNEMDADSMGTGNEQRDLFWWAPGETRSPNLMQETPNGNPNVPGIPKLKLQWCCLQPSYSGGQGFTFVSNGIDKDRASRLRTAPLPQGKGWEDPEFARLRRGDESFPKTPCGTCDKEDFNLKDGHEQVLYWLKRGLATDDDPDCSRSLCQSCYTTKGWQASCQFCNESFCFQHDVQGLKMKICGYRSLSSEKSFQRNQFMKSRPWKYARKIFGSPGLSQWLAGYFIGKGVGDEVVEQLKQLKTPFEHSDEPMIFASEDHARRLNGLSFGPKNKRDVFKALDMWNSLAGFNGIPQEHLACKLFLAAKFLIINKRMHTGLDHQIRTWNGCAAFVCPDYRSIGDHRPNCPAIVKECRLCEILVCPICIARNPPCDCSYCKENYLCPNCYPILRDTACKKAEEVEAARLWRIAKEEADDIVGQAREFFAALDLREETYDMLLEDVS